MDTASICRVASARSTSVLGFGVCHAYVLALCLCRGGGVVAVEPPPPVYSLSTSLADAVLAAPASSEQSWGQSDGYKRALMGAMRAHRSNDGLAASAVRLEPWLCTLQLGLATQAGVDAVVEGVAAQVLDANAALSPSVSLPGEGCAGAGGVDAALGLCTLGWTPR